MCTFFFFFFNDTATTEIYTLSLHDALPISRRALRDDQRVDAAPQGGRPGGRREGDDRHLRLRAAEHHGPGVEDRKSTRLNSSHANISYAVFCLKKKNKN